MVAYLLVRCAERALGVPVGRVIETMRPPHLEVLPHAPSWLAGSAIIRGEPTPVLALDALLQLGVGTRTRLVTVRMSTRRAGVLVDSVDRVVHLNNPRSLATLLPFLDHATVSHLTETDGELVSLLDVLRLVSEDQLTEVMS